MSKSKKTKSVIAAAPPDTLTRKTVWVAWTNTDLTEGRGHSYPLAVCESPETARRLGKSQGVQGSNCPVREAEAFLIDGKWVGPFKLHPEAEVDTILRKDREAKEAVLKKAKSLGLSEADIELLKHDSMTPTQGTKP